MDTLITILENKLRELLGVEGDESWLEDGKLFHGPVNPMRPLELNLPPLGAGPIGLNELLALLERDNDPNDFRRSLPDALAQFTSGIYLTRLAILPGESLSTSHLFLGLSWPAAHWELLPTPHIELQAPGLVLGFSATGFAGRFSGCVGIGEVDFDVLVEFPALVGHGQLTSDSSRINTIKPLLEHFGVRNTPIDNLVLADASFTVDKENERLELRCELDDVLQIEVDPIGTFAVESLVLDYSRDSVQSAVAVGGKVAATIFGLDVHLSATYKHESERQAQDQNADTSTGETAEQDQNGWRFIGAVAQDAPLIVGSMLSAFDLPVKFPESVQRLEFRDLGFDIDLPAGQHRFFGTCHDQFAITVAGAEYPVSASLSLDLTVKKNPREQTGKYRYTGAFTTMLDVNKSHFEIKYELGTNQSIRGHWRRAASDDGFNFIELASSHGLNLSVLAELLQPEEVTLTVDIGEEPNTGSATHTAVVAHEKTTTKPLPVRAGKLQLETVFEHLGDMTLMVARRTDQPPAGASPWIKALGLTVPDISSEKWSLGELPLVGDALRDHALSLTNLRIVAATDDYQGEGDSALTLAGTSYAVRRGMQLHGKLLIRNTSIDESFEFHMIRPDEATHASVDDTRSTPRSDAPATGGDHASATGETAASIDAATATATSESHGGLGKWFTIQKHLGPVELQRIGLEFGQNRIWMLLDVAMSLGPVRLGFDGLGVSVPLNHLQDPLHHLQVALKGINITYDNGPLEIGGALLKMSDDTQDRFDGTATIKAETFTLSALGSYAKPHGGGDESLFLFAVLPTPLGGPPCFYVTGLAAGMGVNQKLILPTVDKIQDFPLVKAAMADGASDFSNADAQGAMALMESSFERKEGQMWLAAGLRFTCFKQVEGFALLTVSFGQRFELTLMGVCRAQMPSETPNPVALVELAFKVSILPDDGVLALDASLTPASYIFSKDCHLTGGFAFHVWFAGKHEGDFALTLGGYHPLFPVPEHYPRAMPLGFQWNLGDLTVKGSIYFAMTPSALMAGGCYEALFHKGRVTGSLVARANFLILWKPFHYEADVSVTISGSVDLFLGSVSFHVGVQLQLWGPPFGGRATVDLSVASFSIGFGAAREPPRPLTWKEFDQAFLHDGACSVRVGQGLVKDMTQSNHKAGLIPGKDDQAVDWVINAEHFLLIIDTKIPIKKSTISWNKEKVKTHDPFGEAAQSYAHRRERQDCTTDFGVSPVALGKNDFEPTLQIGLTREDGCFDEHTVDFVPLIKSVPKALWQAREPNSAPPILEADALIHGALMGYQIVPRELAPDATLPISIGTLQTEVANRIRHFDWQPEISRARESAHAQFEQTSFVPPIVGDSTMATLRAMGLCTESGAA